MIIKSQLLFDAHVHLTDDEYSDYIHQILRNLRALKINACSVTVDLKTSHRSLDLFNSSTRDVVTQFIGIHPQFAETEDVASFIELFHRNNQSIDGIGEIGLDYTYTEHNVDLYQKQKEVFNSMLSLAETTKKPVSIHSRRSLDDILDILKTYNTGNVLLHWFSGSKKQLTKSMDMGLYVSYGPVLVYSDEKKVLLKNTNRDRFLVETDGPVKYSRCFKGLTSLSSSFLVSIINCSANVLGMTYHEAIDVIKTNSEAFLKKSL